MALATQQQVRTAIERSGAAGTAAEVLATITAKTIERTNETPLDNDYIEVALPNLAPGILHKFKLAADQNGRLAAQFNKLCAVGLNFAHPDRLAQIDQLVAAGIWTAEEGDALKGLGVWQESPLEYHGGARELTTDEATVQAALAEIASEQQAAAAALARRDLEIQTRAFLDAQFNRALAAMDAGATTFDELIPVLTSIE